MMMRPLVKIYDRKIIYIRRLVVICHCCKSQSVHFCFAFLLLLCRNLSKPIAVQSKEKEDRYVDNYRVRPVAPFYRVIRCFQQQAPCQEHRDILILP